MKLGAFIAVGTPVRGLPEKCKRWKHVFQTAQDLSEDMSETTWKFLESAFHARALIAGHHDVKVPLGATLPPEGSRWRHHTLLEKTWLNMGPFSVHSQLLDFENVRTLIVRIILSEVHSCVYDMSSSSRIIYEKAP